MRLTGDFFGFTPRRVLALLAGMSLLFFAVGGNLFHQHSKGPETACHICQLLHMPALASASLDLLAAPEIFSRFTARAYCPAPVDSLSLHRASRAPPSL